MQLHNQTSWTSPLRNACSVGRILLSALVCVALFLGQTLPAMAGNPTNTSGGWAEICGDEGSYFIQIGTNGEEPEDAPACVHCDTCLVPPLETQNTPLNQKFLTGLTGFSTISFSIAPSVLTERPEQYWSACRGPPIESTENNMTTHLFSTLLFPFDSVTVTVANVGDLPWV